MATLAGILVADRDSALDSGAAFLLTQECNLSEIIYLDSDFEVEVQKGCPYVVARIRGASGADDAFNKGHEVAQQGLDLLSITGKTDLSIKNAVDEYLVWWREKSTQILRVVTVAKVSAEIGIATFSLTDKDGNIIPQPPSPKLVYHESLRYFRLSQVTDDLFDAFRNAYLAFESLLEYIEPKQQNEKEGQWLKRALNNVNKTIPLSQVYSSKNSDIVSDIYNNIYVRIRCSIFHAKSRSRLTPQNLADRKIVSEELDNLIRIIILLSENWLHVRRPRGFMLRSGFDEMIKPRVLNSAIIVSDNDLLLDNSETLHSSTPENSVSMLTRYAPELSKPGLNSVLGTIEIDKLQKLCKVARFSLVNNQDLLLDFTIEAALTCNSVDRLEAQIGVQLRNVREPKCFFKG